MATVDPIPEQYGSVTPSLSVRGGAAAIEFYTKAFGAQELFRMPMPDGSIAHAEVKFGDSIVMLADEMPDYGNISPTTLGGSGVGLMLYVEDVDAVFKRALEAGATEVRPVENQFYGDRTGTLKDPFGHQWMVATHVEDVSEEEMERRMASWSAEQGGGA